MRQNGRTYAKDLQAHFDYGRIKRWGGNLNVNAHLLDGLHYRGLLRVAQRDRGTRVYEAIAQYVPAHERRMGYYAMPMLWGDEMQGWVNLEVVDGQLQHELGFAGPRRRAKPFQRALEAALQRVREFLEL